MYFLLGGLTLGSNLIVWFFCCIEKQYKSGIFTVLCFYMNILFIKEDFEP